MSITCRTLCAVALCISLVGPGCSDDTDPTPKEDGAVKKNDKGTTTLDTGSPDTVNTGPNSGALCTGPGTCKHVKDMCLFFGGGSKGMCLMNCTPGTTCPKPSPGPYASECAFAYSSGGTKHFACGWYCKYQGADYNCPNDKDYDCVAPDSTEPHVKFCVAK